MRSLALVAISFLIAVSSAHGRELSKTEFVETMNFLFLKGNYDSLVENVDSGLGRYRLGTRDKKEVLYLVGLSCLKLNNFAKARGYFHDILNMRGSEFREDARIGVADSHFQEKDFDRAIRAYGSVLSAYPKSDRLAGVYYNLGLCYKEKKDSVRANSYFRTLKERYEASFEADRLMYLPSGDDIPEFYIIQLGAFRSLRNAKKLVRKLAKRKYDSYILKARSGSGVLYKVRGGKFSNKYYATRLLRRLKKHGFPAKIIVE